MTLQLEKPDNHFSRSTQQCASLAPAQQKSRRLKGIKANKKERKEKKEKSAEMVFHEFRVVNF